MSDGQFVTELYRPTPEKPWIIEEVFIDLDGTMVGSYQAFLSLVLLADFLSKQFGTTSKQSGTTKNQSQVLNDLIHHVRDTNLIQDLLHKPEETIVELANHYANSHSFQLSSPFSIDDVSGLRQNIENSFVPFSGLITFLERLYEAGIPLRIYTNTGPKNTIERLVKMGIDPKLITTIRAKVSADKPFILSEWSDAATEVFARKVEPYTEQKPSPEPFLRAQERGIKADHLLFIGEGLADLGCVLNDPEVLNQFSQFYARFAFQLAGALSTEACADMNNKLRAGHPLGVTHFNEAFPEAPNHPGIKPLRDGFDTLINLLDREAIILRHHTPS